MKGTCHCGAVHWTIQRRPERLVKCNCSICRKLGAVWAHVPVAEVSLSGNTIRYIRSDCDGDISFHSCKVCGATTHWSPTKKDGEVMAVNTALVDPDALEGIPLRHFDGAKTWAFLD